MVGRAPRKPLRQRAGQRRNSNRRATASVCVLIPTYALPPLDYAIPAAMEARVGSVVVVPLSGHPRVGVVLDVNAGEVRDLEEVSQTFSELSLPPKMVEVCRKVSEAAVIPLAATLRAALSPGLGTDRYRVVKPRPGWPWKANTHVGRASLRRRLGSEVLRRAEVEGWVVFDPSPEGPALVEWALPTADADLSRAPKQRLLLDRLMDYPAGIPVGGLLEASGARRQTLRELVRRGLASVVRRPKPLPVAVAGGAKGGGRGPFTRQIERVLERGGPWIWRTPTDEQAEVVAALVGAARRRGEQTLVVAPEIRTVERVGAALAELLPRGTTISVHHSKMGNDRAAVYAALRAGEVDVVVGTRTASLFPMARPGPICVVDEPNEAHRAPPGFEGLPVHARDVALERCATHGGATLFLSPFPSLRLYGSARGVRELRPRPSRRPPDVRLVDMRGTGAVLSGEVVEACREGDRVGVVASRLGYATSVVCARCGTVRFCPRCGLPLSMGGDCSLACGRCGFATSDTGTCEVCGSERVVPTGLAAERIRNDLTSALGEPVGLLTADSEGEGRVVVGTAHAILAASWDAVILPDVDAVLFASSTNRTERAFRLLFAATEVAGDSLVVQTRAPEEEVLSSALRGDYATFATAQLPRLEALGYPPFGHVVALTFSGPEGAARRAVKSGLRGAVGEGTTVSDLVRSDPAAGAQHANTWRLLLRSPDLVSVAEAGARIARQASKERLRVRVEVDPEEV